MCADVAACELKSGTLYPATFLDRGPDEDIRAAGRFVQNSVRYLRMLFTSVTCQNCRGCYCQAAARVQFVRLMN